MTYPTRHYTVGFDRMFQILDRLDESVSRESYPPYNIVKTKDNWYTIELAVAGFTRDQISVVQEDNNLTITGVAAKQDADFIHRGISGRSFKRQFVLADTVEVRDVYLENGILRVEIENVIPEHKKPRTLEIRDGGRISSTPQLLVESNEKEKDIVASTLLEKDSSSTGS